jgi:hypothetical protein
LVYQPFYIHSQVGGEEKNLPPYADAERGGLPRVDPNAGPTSLEEKVYPVRATAGLN